MNHNQLSLINIQFIAEYFKRKE